MVNAAPSTLAPELLARRLAELTGAERDVQVDFLLHLDEFDRRRAFLEAGYDSLWSYCLSVLHLREGPAGRRIAAMRALRRFPALAAPLRDGRLCLTTVTVLGPVLTAENLDDLVARAAYRTKAEVEQLAVAIQPRIAPKDGVRKIADSWGTAPHAGPLPASGGEGEGTQGTSLALAVSPTPIAPAAAASAHTKPGSATRPSPPSPVTAGQWSLRVTLSAEMKADLDTLASLLSHAKGGDLSAVLHDAIRCGIAKHGKRKGAVAPQRARSTPADRPGEEAPPPGLRTAIPAHVRREVWVRDGGRCAWTSADGHRCGSRWKLEFDHLVPVARGGGSTASNVRLACQRHNQLHAEQTFGRKHMARFAGAQLILG